MSSRLPAPKAYAALIGGLYASQPDAAETLYYLKNGMSIEKMKKINAAEVIEIIKRNTALGIEPLCGGHEIALLPSNLSRNSPTTRNNHRSANTGAGAYKKILRLDSFCSALTTRTAASGGNRLF
ncbi:MAG: hypothetical protein U0798_19575 [Gemmataceae bacterium]